MFTIDEIKAAHSKVKSGADFPAYIQDLKKLGVVSYQTYVADGHTDYSGSNGYKTATPPKYEPLAITAESNAEQFQNDLKAHQQGQTDYPTFCRDCAKSGIEKWIVSLEQMTCTYYGKAGTAVLTEVIPG